MWFIFTETTPFNNSVHTAYDFVVKENSRPKIPDYVPQEIKDMIWECWVNTARTIKFAEIWSRLLDVRLKYTQK